MKFKKEHKTAVIVLTALLLFIWGFNFLKGKDIFKTYDTYYTILDNVEGVVQSTPVTLKGIQIGTVEQLKFYNGLEKTMMVLNIDSHYRFPQDSKVKVYGGNIMGGKSVAIIPGKEKTLAKDGDTLTVMKMPGMFDLVNDKITPLQNKLERILTATDTLLWGINNVLNPKTQKALSSSMEDLAVVMKQLKHTMTKLDNFMTQNQEHLNNSLANLDKTTENFARLSDSLQQLDFQKTVQRLNQTVANFNKILEKLNNGQGTMGKLMNDKKLYDNLERSSKELELLLKDFREHPKRYVHFSVWGRKDK